ncbi:hypothetical protein [Xylanimonas sp. McL0601]
MLIRFVLTSFLVDATALVVVALVLSPSEPQLSSSARFGYLSIEL